MHRTDIDDDDETERLKGVGWDVGSGWFISVTCVSSFEQVDSLKIQDKAAGASCTHHAAVQLQNQVRACVFIR